MKRVFVLIREFSWENKDESFVLNGNMEVFTTFKNAKDYISRFQIRTTVESENNGGSDYCYRLVVTTDSGSYMRWTIVGRNLNAKY